MAPNLPHGFTFDSIPNRRPCIERVLLSQSGKGRALVFLSAAVSTHDWVTTRQPLPDGRPAPINRPLARPRVLQSLRQDGVPQSGRGRSGAGGGEAGDRDGLDGGRLVGSRRER